VKETEMLMAFNKKIRIPNIKIYGSLYITRSPEGPWIAHLRNRSKGHSGVPFHTRSTISKEGTA